MIFLLTRHPTRLVSQDCHELSDVKQLSGVSRDVVDDPGLHVRGEESSTTVDYHAKQVLILFQVFLKHLYQEVSHSRAEQ